MPFNGLGTFTPPAPEFPAVSGDLIRSSHFNTIINDIATGLSACIPRNGESAWTGMQNAGNQRLTMLADGVNAQDAVNKRQLDAKTAPSQLLTDIKTVDGAGSGLDADLLDGKDSSAFLERTGGDLTGRLCLRDSPDGNPALELGKVDGVASYPYIDFHSGSTVTDFDSRIMASGGNGSSGGGNLEFVSTKLTWNGINLAVPAGAIAFFAWSSAPNGWLKANGAAVSRTVYARLFEAIGTTFGAGDGSTTFNLPDLRGEFLRGWDDGRGVDTGRVFGSWQRATAIAGVDDFNSDSIFYFGQGANIDGDPGGDGVVQSLWAPLSSSGNTGATDNYKRTRPRNIAMLACIKY